MVSSEFKATSKNPNMTMSVLLAEYMYLLVVFSVSPSLGYADETNKDAWSTHVYRMDHSHAQTLALGQELTPLASMTFPKISSTISRLKPFISYTRTAERLTTPVSFRQQESTPGRQLDNEGEIQLLKCLFILSPYLFRDLHQLKEFHIHLMLRELNSTVLEPRFVPGVSQ